MCLHIDGGKKFNWKVSRSLQDVVVQRYLCASCDNLPIAEIESFYTKKNWRNTRSEFSMPNHTFLSHARQTATNDTQNKTQKMFCTYLTLFIDDDWRATNLEWFLCAFVWTTNMQPKSMSLRNLTYTMVVRQSTSSQQLFSTFHLIRIGFVGIVFFSCLSNQQHKHRHQCVTLWSCSR